MYENEKWIGIYLHFDKREELILKKVQGQIKKKKNMDIAI